MRRVLSQNFFNRPTERVAKELLGKFLVRKIGRRISAYMITEVEVYDGFRDKASHASRGRTKRNTLMFGPPGHWYVYFTYGMHWMLNVVTREKGYPAAILIRACASGYDEPRQGRATNLNGPARLTKKLHIDKKLNGLVTDKSSGLWVEERGVRMALKMIKKDPRVGVSYAGPYWSKRKLRLRVNL